MLEKGLSFSLEYISSLKVQARTLGESDKTSTFVAQKQNKKKLTSNKKTITNEFRCFDVRTPYCNLCFFLQQKNNKSYTALFLLISCLNKYNNKFSHALLFWFKYIHCNYGFRRRQHSYAACDGALAASKFINVLKTSFGHS